MSKKLILLAFASVVLFSCQQEKTAFVDNEKLIEGYQERKDIEAKYKTKVENLTKKKDSLGQILQKEGTLLQAKGAKMNQAQQQELYAPYIQKRQFLQQQLQQEEQEIGKQSQEEIDTLLKKIDDAILEYGKANSYVYVFGKNKAGSVLYGTDKNDITQTILDKLNLKYSETK